jgi:hypothetical protein
MKREGEGPRLNRSPESTVKGRSKKDQGSRKIAALMDERNHPRGHARGDEKSHPVGQLL